MPEITFTRVQAKYAAPQNLFDKVLQDGGININQDDYVAVLDRIYNVLVLNNMHAELKNTGSTNDFTYKIEKARKKVADVSTLVDADFDQDIQGNTDVLVAVKAFGTVTIAGVLAGDTVTINGLAYTAVAGVKADNTEFSIDSTDTASATDLADSITNDTRIGTLDDVIATSAAAIVTATQTVTGTNGDTTTLVSSDGTRLAVSGATFTDGIDGESIKNIIDLSPETTAIRIRFRRKTAGQDTTLAGFVSVN